MGLDISAYTKCEKVGSVKDGEEWEDNYSWSETTYLYELDFFHEHAEGVEANGVYTYKDSHAFRAGSYSGYNQWREWLCDLALGVEPKEVWENPEQYKDKPFYWLINFSDCEGVIGPVKSKILSGNFREYQEKANELDNNSWLLEKYNEWRKAFDMAADGGFVEFH